MSTPPRRRALPALAPGSFDVRQVTNAQASWRHTGDRLG